MALSRIKLLIFSLSFILTVSCAPSFITPTPIPPLDPNAIGTFVAQTADVSSVQTMAALPTLTAAPTFTSTARSTFTPEATFTPVQPIIFSSPTPTLRLKYYRIKHDNQLAILNFKSRTFDENSQGLLRQTPEVVPLFLAPKDTAGTGRTTVDGAWEFFINALNENDEGKLRYLKSSGTALFNNAGFPQMESLTMGGNIITLDQIQGGWGRVSTLDYGSPPNADSVNYITRPDLVHKFVVVGWRRSTKSTIIVNPPRGDIYYPLVSRRPVWIQMDRLEAFPPLPMDITINSDVYVQSTPGPSIEKTELQLSAGDSATLIDYYPSGSNVWGRIRTGWIPLLLDPQYLTSWTMETIPPPP